MFQSHCWRTPAVRYGRRERTRWLHPRNQIGNDSSGLETDAGKAACVVNVEEHFTPRRIDRAGWIAFEVGLFDHRIAASRRIPGSCRDPWTGRRNLVPELQINDAVGNPSNMPFVRVCRHSEERRIMGECDVGNRCSGVPLPFQLALVRAQRGGAPRPKVALR